MASSLGSTTSSRLRKLWDHQPLQISLLQLVKTEEEDFMVHCSSGQGLVAHQHEVKLQWEVQPAAGLGGKPQKAAKYSNLQNEFTGRARRAPKGAVNAVARKDVVQSVYCTRAQTITVGAMWAATRR